MMPSLLIARRCYFLIGARVAFTSAYFASFATISQVPDLIEENHSV
jgi:hypothetical protein